MLEPPDDDLLELPELTPVITWSPGWTPEMICVLTPSLIPVWTATDTGAPFRSTLTLPLLMAAFGTSIALSADWAMMLTVAVISGSSWTSVGSTVISTLYVTTFDVVVP